MCCGSGPVAGFQSGPPYAYADMEAAIIIVLIGLGFCFVGYGPLSLKKNPTAGDGFAVVGFLFRLAGLLLLIFGIMLMGAVLSWRMP